MTGHYKDPLRQVRDFLYQVRDGCRAITNLEKRIAIHRSVLELNKDDEMEQMLTGEDIAGLERERIEKQRTFAVVVLNVSEAISRLPDVNQQMVLTLRYVDMISDWNKIADKMGMTKAAVQKLHGRALPQLQKLLTHLYGETE